MEEEYSLGKQGKQTDDTTFNILIPKNVGSGTVLHRAAACGYTKSIKILVDGNPLMLEALDKHGRTPMHIAAICGEPEALRQLIKLGSDINKEDVYGNTVALFASMGLSCDELCLRSLSIIDEIDTRVSEGTLLHTSAACGNTDMIKLLARVDPLMVDALDKYGRTPLHMSAICNRVEVLEQLLELGANINIRDMNGDSAVNFIMLGLNCDEFCSSQ